MRVTREASSDRLCANASIPVLLKSGDTEMFSWPLAVRMLQWVLWGGR